MKKIMLLVASLFIYAGASASNVEKIQFANSGDFSLGLMAGIPPHMGNMPFVSIDGMVGLKDGFIHTNKFGDNGAVDLGVLAGFQTFNDGDYWTLPIVARGSFHFEFVKNLDLYAGILSGVELYHWSYEEMYLDESGSNELTVGETRKGTDIKFVYGTYLGAKWHFTEHFGLKVEFTKDWKPYRNQLREHKGALPWFAGGLSFKF